MRAKKYKYALEKYKYNPLEWLKIWLKGAKWPLRNGFLGVKSGYLGLENDEPATKLERQNGAKCKQFP